MVEEEYTEFEVIPGTGLWIRSNDRILIIGMNETGKTQLATHWLLPHYPRYVFHDPKGESKISHDILVHTPEELADSIKLYNKILYVPKTLLPKDFNEVCKVVADQRDLAFYVDEAGMYTAPNKIEEYYDILITVKRTSNIAVINVAQRPREIHNVLITESRQFFIFMLQGDTDREKLRTIIGNNATEELRYLEPFRFLYHNSRVKKSVVLETYEDRGQTKLRFYKPSLERYMSIVKGLQYMKR